MFIRFDVIHERDRRTLHDSKDRACIASHGKKKVLMKRQKIHVICSQRRNLVVTMVRLPEDLRYKSWYQKTRVPPCAT